jgi:hypothetical protein
MRAATVKWKAQLGNVPWEKLQHDLGKGLGGLEGACSERSSEVTDGGSAVAAETRASVSTQFGLGNKCACRL